MTADILETLAESARGRVASAKKNIPSDKIRELAFDLKTDTGYPFEKALDTDRFEFICECKKASPSKGLIAPDFPYLQIAEEYRDAGAACISVLTEPTRFLGQDRYLQEISEKVRIPSLRKDFVVDEYMIYQAKLLGASAVLLICAILDEKSLNAYSDLSRELGLSVLCEAHDKNEVELAVSSGARVIGVNNRDLRTFDVDLRNCIRLRDLVPDDRIFVAESGIKTAGDIALLHEAGVDAALVGESLMRSPDKRKALAELRGRPMTKIKFCGMTRPLDIAAANEVGPDYIGFVFAEESPRFVPPEAAKSLTDGLSPDIPVFGVFRGVSFEDIVDIAKMDFIDAIQLHGDESNRFVRLLRTFTGLPIVKAFAVGPSFDREEAYASEADMILLDSGAGTGKTFDWELLKDFDREYILAGGLDPGNVGEAVARLHPAVVDTSSGIESDRRKDPEKMKQFKTAVVRADSLSNEEQR